MSQTKLTGQAGTSFLTFELAGLRLALPAEQVRKLVRAVKITPLPGAPSVVEGIIDVAGEIVPVLDLRARFGLPSKPLDPSDTFILAFDGDRELALHVGHALGLVSLPSDECLHSPAVYPGVRYLTGIASVGGELVVIQDLASVLSHDERLSLLDAIEKTKGRAA